MILLWLIGLLVIAQPVWAQPLPDPLRVNQVFANQTTSKVVDYVVISTPPLAPTGACRLYADGTSLYMSCNGGAYAAFGVAGAGVTSLTGTANQVTVSAATGAITLSLPSAVTLPGSGTVTTRTGTPAAATTFDNNGKLVEQAGVSQAFVVCTGAACATSCTLTFTVGILTGSSGTCP